MVAIYDPDRLVGGHEVELNCLDPEYYEDWVPFAARAPRAGCAVVVLGNETTGQSGIVSDDPWSNAECVLGDRVRRRWLDVRTCEQQLGAQHV
jgi:hypothetical protein